MSEQTKDQSVLDKIQTLVTEEHRMFGKGSLSDSDRARLEKINVELDQCRIGCVSVALSAKQVGIRRTRMFARRRSSKSTSSEPQFYFHEGSQTARPHY